MDIYSIENEIQNSLEGIKDKSETNITNKSIDLLDHLGSKNKDSNDFAYMYSEYSEQSEETEHKKLYQGLSQGPSQGPSQTPLDTKETEYPEETENPMETEFPEASEVTADNEILEVNKLTIEEKGKVLKETESPEVETESPKEDTESPEENTKSQDDSNPSIIQRMDVVENQVQLLKDIVGKYVLVDKTSVDKFGKWVDG